MALLFMDGFEVTQSTVLYSNNGCSAKWVAGLAYFTNAGVGSQPAGVTARCMHYNGSGGRHSSLEIPSTTTLIIGFHCRVNGTSDPNLINLSDTAGASASFTRGVKVYRNTDGSLSVMRNATVLCTSLANIFPINSWQHLELKAVFGASGSVELRLDGVVVCSQSSVDTQGSVTGGYTIINFNNSWSPSFDNLYVLDGTGTTNNNYLGAVVVQTLPPNAAGSITGMTPSAGNNYECVDETPVHDSSTTYVKTSSTGVSDLYALSNLAGTVTSVHGVMVTSQTAQYDTGVQRKARNLIKTGANSGNGPTYTLFNAIWTQGAELYEVQPGTSDPWTEATVNAMEIGFETVP